MSGQMGFYFDQTRCIGCLTCILACKQWHVVGNDEPQNWRRVHELEKGKFPNVALDFHSYTCYHCQQPACVEACATHALVKRPEDGVVLVDQTLCLGKECAMCVTACEYEIPQFGPGSEAKVEKCDFCLDRLAEGKKPLCVAACRTRAMDAGPLEVLRERYGQGVVAEGFVYSEKLQPAIVLKRKGKRAS